MNPKTIRKIDLYVGVPLCFILTLYDRLTSLFRRKKCYDIPKKVLFLKFIEQGATILAYDALKRAIDRVSSENVYFCVFRSNVPVLYFLNIIPDKNILIIEDKDFIKFIISSMKVLYKIRKEKIDTCIDMEFFSRASAIFSYLSGCKNRVGLHRFNAEQPFRGDLMTHKVNHNPHIHISQYYRMLVDVVFEDKLAHERPHNKLEIIDKEKIQLPSYTPDESLIQNIKKIIYDEFKEDIFSIKDKKLVLLNPNAGDLLPIRKWDSENYIELAYRLLNYDKNIYILLTGAPSERDAVEAMKFKINHGRVGSMAGKTSFKDLITLYYVSDLLVTNDSGPGHFTTLTSTRTIVLFGPETPLLFGSLSKNVRTIWKNLGCSPCVNVYNHRFSPCNNSICMKSITIDEVFHLCIKLLDCERNI